MTINRCEAVKQGLKAQIEIVFQEEEEDEERHPDPEPVQRPRPQCILRKPWQQIDASGCVAYSGVL